MPATVKVENLTAGSLAELTPGRSIILSDAGTGWPHLVTLADVRTALLAGGVGFNAGDTLPITEGGTGVTTGLSQLNASNLNAGTVPVGRLGASGTPSSSTFLRGDNTWATPAGAGDALTTNPLSQFAATTSAQLAGVISDETGSGVLVFSASPTLTGTVTAANLTTTGLLLTAASGTGSAGLRLPHGTAPTSPTNGDVWTTTGGLYVRINGSTVGPLGTGGGGGGDALTTNPLSQFAATTSAQLAGVISDETGSGALVFANTPTLVTPVLGVATATSINKVAITAPATSATLTIADGATLTASATATVSGTNTGDQTSVTGNAGTATALQTARTINGTSFDGTANITVTAAAGTLTGSTLASGVTASSLTSVGTLSALTVSGLLLTAASGTGSAGFRLPHGTAPTSPTNGDVWTTTSGLLARINGTTVTFSIVGHTHAASDIASGTIATARLGSGTASSSTFLRGDNTWQTIPGGGDALTTSPLSQFAATTSAQLAGVISDETGSGALVFANTPTLVTPVLGVATATSINKVAITAPTTSATLTIADGATLTASASATVSGTNTGDQTSVTGNAGTATALQTARTINGTSFDGTANITITAAAGTLTGGTLASGVTASSLTSVGTLSALTLGGTLSMADNELNRPYFSDYAEKASTPSISAGAITIDYTAGNVAIVTMNANITSMTLSNPPASGRVGELTLILKQDGTGSRTVTWPAAVKWPGGTAPTLSGANKVDIVTLITDDAGTTWYGASAVNY